MKYGMLIIMVSKRKTGNNNNILAYDNQNKIRRILERSGIQA